MSVIGLKRGEVKLAPYSDEWGVIADGIIKELNNILAEIAVDIQHIGSTAVKGMAAKPIIDIVVGVRNIKDIEKYIPRLEESGYIKRPRDVENQELFVCGDFSQNTRTCHIHIVKYNEEAWNNYIKLRDYLISDRCKAKEYERLKKKLAERYPDNRTAYTKGKSNLIESFIEEAEKKGDQIG